MQYQRVVFLLAVGAVSAAAAGKPEDEFAATLKGFLGKAFVNDWVGLEKLPKTTWAPLPPQALQNCAPDGGCFARQGATVFGDRKFALMVTGARTMANNFYLRNPGAPLGEPAVLAALQEAGIKTELARCPAKEGVGGTNWYRLSSTAHNPGILSVQSSCNGKPCEGFVITPGRDLPALLPNQLQLYTEQCSMPAAERKPVSTKRPHEQLAELVAALVPPNTGAPLRIWSETTPLPSGVQWPQGAGPKKVDLSFKNDPNPFSVNGTAALAGRQFSVLASGSPTQAKTFYFEETGLHPRGEHLLGVIYTLGLTVKLVRCGPVYTESTNNWYSLTSAKTHPVMLKQSIRYDGNQVQDSYELRLDASLPARDTRDREPGMNGCR